MTKNNVVGSKTGGHHVASHRVEAKHHMIVQMPCRSPSREERKAFLPNPSACKADQTKICLGLEWGRADTIIQHIPTEIELKLQKIHINKKSPHKKDRVNPFVHSSLPTRGWKRCTIV